MEWTLRLVSRPRRAQIIAERRRAAVRLQRTEPQLAEVRLRELVELSTRVLGADRPATLDVRLALGICQNVLGRYADAIETFDASIPKYNLAIHHNGQLISRSSCALARSGLGEHAAAVVEARAAFDESRASWGDDAAVTLQCRETLAGVLRAAEQFAEAVEHMTIVVASRVRFYGPTHRRTLCGRHELGRFLVAAGEFDRAAEEFTAALADPAEHPSCTLTCETGLARVAAGQGRTDEAVRRYEEVIKGWTDLYGADSAAVREVRDELAAIAD